MADRPADRLDIGTGLCSEQGERRDNQDFAALRQDGDSVSAALADGVGGAKGGRVAAELTVRGLLDALDGLSAHGVRHAATTGLAAINGWVHAIGRTDPALEGMATTLTALLLRGRQAHVVHVGDSRAYRLRAGSLVQLTTDHAGTGAHRHILTRAVGAEDGIRIDHASEAALVGDRYLLCSDGVHGGLSNRQLAAELATGSAEEAARRIVAAALASRIGDNATALVIDLLALPPANRLDLERTSSTLPILPPPGTGAVIDGYRLGTMLADGRYSRVFRAIDEARGGAVVIKFPKPIPGAEPVLRQAFLRESWIASQVRSPFVGETIEPPDGRRSGLYVVMPFYAGETLEQLLSRTPPIRLARGLDIAIKLAKGVAALHRAGIIHRDIKPDNVVLLPDGAVRLIDLGVARLPFLEDLPEAEPPGTASYMAPELFDGAAGNEHSDVFALGVTIYRMFCGAWPYGEVEPFGRRHFGRPTPLLARRPDLPPWLDALLARAVEIAPARRPDAVELAFELEGGAIRAASAAPAKRSFYERDALRFWQIVAILLALALALSWIDWSRMV